MAAFGNEYTFCRMHMLTPFCIKTNLRENRFFATRWRLVDGKGTQNVKILAEKQTKAIAPCMPIGVKSKDNLDMCKLAHKAIST